MHAISIRMVRFFVFDQINRNSSTLLFVGDLLISSSDDDTIVVYDCESGL